MNISCKNARGRVVQYTPGPLTKVIINGRNWDHEFGIYHIPSVKILLKKFPGEYKILVKGGGIVSRINLGSHLLYRYHRSKDSSSIPKECEISHIRTTVRYPKRYGGKSSRARYQKSYR